MLRQPLKTEVAAAVAVAARAGLGAVTPELLHLGNHTTVRLKPWPIVARIASGTTFDFWDGSLARELKIAAHLASREAPSTRPSRAVPPGPYSEGDCVVTLWEWVDGRPAVTDDDARMAAASLRCVHSALLGLDADLPSFIEKVDSCETILSNPDQAPELAGRDRRFLQDLYERLRPALQELGRVCQPLHGDPHLANALITDKGAVWLDLESVCIGPVEWDVGFLPAETWSEFPDVDPALMRLCSDVHSLCVATWCWAEFDRSAATREAATDHLEELKVRFG